MDRRRFLRAGAASALPTAIAGCPLGGSAPDATPADDEDSPNPATPTGTPAAFDHPAATAIGEQPWLGPPPGTAEGTIVAFEDPSCPTCRRFERQTFPKLKRELTDAGRATFVFRTFPVVYPWGRPASRILEAAFDRSPGAFWALKAHYYDAQREFTTENVAERSRTFLAENTGVDAAAVLAAVETGESEAAVQADLDAGERAGARGTPTFFLFAGTEFRTEIVGPQSYSVFANALGL